MHSHHRARGKILFEVLCALSLAASFAAAWDEIGSPALLASAAIVALFAVYWSFGLFARRHVAAAAQPVAEVRAAVPEAEVPAAAPEPQFADVPPEVQFAAPAESLAETEPVAAAPKKRPARKSKKAAAAAAPSEFMVAIEEPAPDPFPLEQLFDPQPFVRQARPAFGRKSRGPRPLSAA